MTMKQPLTRLLRLRSLLEDVSRVELEARLQELAQIERALVRSQDFSRAMRRRSFAGIAQAQSADCLEAEAVGEWVTSEEKIFEKASQSKTAEVNAAKAAYHERRKERHQVGSVIEAKAAAEAIEQGRREQQELDDWFNQQGRSGRGAGAKLA
jgi:flagellar export protein FliJ